MSEYQSIKPYVLSTLERKLPEIHEQFGIDMLGIFGSVSRGEDTPDSDIDILYQYGEGRCGGLLRAVDLVDYLENLFGRRVDLTSIKWMKPYFRAQIESDMILFSVAGV